jgi:hypothetical protein
MGTVRIDGLGADQRRWLNIRLVQSDRDCLARSWCTLDDGIHMGRRLGGFAASVSRKAVSHLECSTHS